MTDKKYRILAIDGGGIKGMIPAAFLASVEQSTGKRIVDHFDLIAGTSTGGIVALGLGLGMSAAEIVSFYENDGPRIFSAGPTDTLYRKCMEKLKSMKRSVRRAYCAKHNPDALKEALIRAFGERILGESQTRLLIPAFDRQRSTVHVFKTSHHERLTEDWQRQAVDVALSTAAAITYLPSHRMSDGVSLIDGGVWANNPAGPSVVEAIGILKWPMDNIYVLSLGCSEYPLNIPEDPSSVRMMFEASDIFFQGQSHASLGTAKLLTWQSPHDRRLFRYSPTVPKGAYSLDSAHSIPALKGLGNSLAREAMPEIRDIFFDVQRSEFIPFHGIRSTA